MKIKFTPLILVLSIISTFSFGQMNRFNKGEINFGEEFKIKDSFNGYLGNIGDNMYLSSAKLRLYRASNLSINIVDAKTLAIKKSATIELSYKDETFEASSFTIFNGKLYAFSSYKNKELGKSIVVAQELDPITLTPSGDLKLITDKDYEKSGLFSGISHTYETSRNNQYLISYSENFNVKKNDLANIAISVLDKDLNQVISRTVDFQIPNKLLEIQDVDVDQNGVAYILIKENLEKGGDVKKGEVNIRYRLFELKSEEELREIKIETEGNLVAAANILIYEDKIFISGIYKDYNRKAEGLKGVFLAEVSKEGGKPVKVTTKEVGADFFTEGLSEKDQKKMKKKLDKGKAIGTSYKLKHIIELADGSFIITAEEDYVVTYTYTDSNGNTKTRTIYNANNVLITKLSTSGEIEWVQNVRKRQAVSNPIVNSYVPCQDQNNLYLVFNSHKDNMNTAKTYDAGKIVAFTGNSKKTFAEVVSVDLKNGEYKREMLFSPKESNTYIVPSLSEMVDNTCYVYSVKGKKKQFTTIVF